MKAKLLKKVRRKYRIVKNGLGIEFIQEKDLFGWGYPPLYIMAMVEKLYDYSDTFGEFRALLDYKYSKHKRINQINKKKEKQLTKIWHNVNS